MPVLLSLSHSVSLSRCLSLLLSSVLTSLHLFHLLILHFLALEHLPLNHSSPFTPLLPPLGTYLSTASLYIFRNSSHFSSSVFLFLSAVNSSISSTPFFMPSSFF